LLAGLRKNYSTGFSTKFGGKVAHGPRKKRLEFGGNPYHVTLGLGLRRGGAETDAAKYSAWGDKFYRALV